MVEVNKAGMWKGCIGKNRDWAKENKKTGQSQLEVGERR
jgi:hypothetical protein